ncbi:MAG: hypothetical protein KIH44_003530 [Octadecabacter sp.]|nr:hypothetical protein [Octadecabacter sp.]
MRQAGYFFGAIGKGLLSAVFSILKLVFAAFRGCFRKMPLVTSILTSAIVGFFVGSFIGASMGVAFGGGAVNGAVVFGPIGAVIGFLFGPWIVGAYRALKRKNEEKA